MSREWENFVAAALDAAQVYYVREVHFGSYRADFVLVGLDIVLEIDGIEHRVQPRKRAIDHEKDRIYQQHSFTVIRIKHEQLERYGKKTLKWLMLRIQERQRLYAENGGMS